VAYSKQQEADGGEQKPE